MNSFKNICQAHVLIFLLSVTMPAFAQKSIRLESPDGHLVFSFRFTGKAPVYQVAYKGKTLIEDSELGLSFQGEDDFGPGLRPAEPRFREAEETYELPVGKARKVRDPYREVTIPMIEGSGEGRLVNLCVRAFDDGLAFRYEFPEQKGWEAYSLSNENSAFRIRGNPTMYALLFNDYINSHEGPYHVLELGQLKPGQLVDLPVLFEFPGGTYMAVTEAALRDYASMYLTKRNGVLSTQLSPLPGQTDVKVKATLPHRTPWRVMLISDRVGALIESNILTSLNEPTGIQDLSWIKPGKTTFHWWNGDVIPDTTIRPGINFQTNKYYIDFCARHNIDYHAVIGYGGVAWYQHDGTGYGTARLDSGLIRPVPGLDMQQICDYARQKGVGIHVWVHWNAIYPRLEENFARFEKWGINGMMVDFMNRDDQEMVNIQEEILRSAARHKLYIQFHGAFKPTGLSRTYPNEFTREGTLNYEVNKWSEKGLSPDHDIMMPFTRLLAGTTDYHLGGFRAVPEAEFKTQYTRPLMAGTRCHMLAMYVVLESYLASLCDYPAAYEGQPGFEFLKEVPTTWDETRVPAAEVGEYVTIARRKGTGWYVGTINNNTSRTIKVPLDFLPEGDYNVEIYSDAPDVAEHPSHLTRETRVVSHADILTLEIPPGGGQVMKLEKQAGK